MKKEKNIVTEILIDDCSKFVENAPSINAVDSNHAWCCNILSNYIDIAGYNRSKSHSIPGYLPSK